MTPEERAVTDDPTRPKEPFRPDELVLPEVPAPDDVTGPWWAATGEHRLLLQRCAPCDHVQHPPRAVCTRCGTPDPGWTEASGRGVVDAHTVVHRAPRPGRPVPYVVARVRLAEGPVLLTNLDVPPADHDVLHTGQPVTVRWRDLPEGRALPVFVPEES